MADGTPHPPLQLESREIAHVTTRLLVDALNEFPIATTDDMALATALASVIRSVEKNRPGARVRAVLYSLLSDPRV